MLANIFLCIFLIITLLSIYSNYVIYNEIFYPTLTISITACNRYTYLNQTIHSLYKHLYYYESKIKYNVVYFDQGTLERYNVINKYRIYNAFLFNPSGMELSFNTLFSYVYTQYIFLLEEDWVVDKNVEIEILHPSFITESLLILSKVNKIYGIILRETDRFEIHENLTINTKMGRHIVYIGILKNKYAFTNGASVYKTRTLKEIKYYRGEKIVSNFFLKKGYKLGFTYKGRKGISCDIHYQHVMDHIGTKTSKSSVCSKALY